MSAAAANTVRVGESPCSDDNIIIKLIIHTAAVGRSVGRVFCGSRSPEKRGRDGHCCTTCARTAGGNRLLSTRTKYDARVHDDRGKELPTLDINNTDITTSITTTTYRHRCYYTIGGIVLHRSAGRMIMI